MKHTILILSLLLGICCWSMPQLAMAEDAPSGEVTKTKKKKKKKSKKDKSKKATGVAKSFKEMTFFKAAGSAAREEAEENDDEENDDEETVSPATNAKYYIYLSSASWCGPCKMLMPKFIEQYDEMKKKKVELILISCDRTVEEGQKYLEHYKAEFCGVMAGEAAAKSLPGYQAAKGIPHAIIVDKKGKVLASDHGAHILDAWKKLCK